MSVKGYAGDHRGMGGYISNAQIFLARFGY